jgi:acyl-CoA synthetase (AMP-forming)/AMP-acid ligase II
MKASSILERSSTIYSDECLFWCGDEAVSYKKAFHLYEQYKLWIWRGIQSAIQKIEGQHVEIIVTFLSRNTPELLLFILACIDISGSYDNGGIHIYTAMLNVRWSATEMAQALKINAEGYINQSGINSSAQRQGIHYVTLILCEDNFLKVARDTRTLIGSDSIQHEATVEVLPTMFQMESHIRTFEVMTRNHTDISSRDQLNRDAIILFTSGTTSGPKGVRLSHLSLILQAMAMTSSPCGYNVESRIMGNCVPFFHVGGLSSALTAFALEDEKFGESVCAAIVSVAGKIKNSFESMQWRDELRSFCAQKDLAGYKRPRRVFILKDLPQNSSGKVLKNELKLVCEGLKTIPKSRL